MLDSDSFSERHFPPPLVFANGDAKAAHKSQLIIEARLLAETPLRMEACLLFSQAAFLEEQLVAEGYAGGPGAADRRLSAASCHGRAGDLESALLFFERSRDQFDDETQGFVRLLQLRRTVGGPAARKLTKFSEARDLASIQEAVLEGIGLFPPRHLLWPLFRVAQWNGKEDIAARALRYLIIALPHVANFHVIWAAERRKHEKAAAVEYARYAARGLAQEFGCQASLAGALLDAGSDPGEALRVAIESLRLLRAQPEKVAKSPPSQVAVVFCIAAVLSHRLGKLEEAQAILDEGLGLLPNDAELRTLLGMVLLARKETEQAYLEFDKAYDSGKARSHWPASFAGAGRLERGKATEALDCLRKAVAALQGSRSEIYARNLSNLGVALAMTGNPGGAEDSFARALSISPQLASARDNLAALRAEATSWTTEEVGNLGRAFEDFFAEPERFQFEESEAVAA